jgi:hypothetical protein
MFISSKELAAIRREMGEMRKALRGMPIPGSINWDTGGNKFIPLPDLVVGMFNHLGLTIKHTPESATLEKKNG